MKSLAARSVLFALVALMPCFTIRAESVVDHLPDDAMAFAVVRNLSATNAKVERLLKIFEDLSPTPLPSPLQLAKAATGLGAGLNEEGDVMLALLRGEDGAAMPRPLLLAPVSDYGSLAESIEGDATGEICRVTIAGEEVLVAKRGAFAVFMNVEHRDRLESLVAAEPKSAESIAPMAKWLDDSDFAAVLTPVGLKALTAMGKAGIDAQRSQLEEDFGDPDMAEAPLKQMQQSLAIFDAMLGFLGAEVEAVGVALSIDDATNLRLTQRVLLSKDGELASIKAVPTMETSPLAGYAAGSFVFAAGGPMPAGWTDAMSKAGRNWMQQFAGIYGLESLEEDQWKEMESVWKTAMEGLSSMSMVLEPGEEDDPLYSNAYCILKVKDAKAYLKSQREAITMWNELLANSTAEINLQYEIEDATIDGHDALSMTLDIGAAAADPNVPMMQPMMEAMFGEGGKMRMHVVAADDETIVSGIGNEKLMSKAIKRIADKELGLAESPEVQTTTKLLDAKAPWQGFVSPQGSVAWFRRMMNKMMMQFGGGAPPIPEYPESPPVGFSMNFDDGQFRGEMVWPVATLEALAEFIEACQ